MSPRPLIQPNIELPENLRFFDDQSITINEALGLYVFSSQIERLKRSISKGRYDPNNDEIIYDKQVQAELVEYVRMSYARFDEVFSTSAAPLSDIEREREAVYLLDRRLQRLSNSGELNRLLKRLGKF